MDLFYSCSFAFCWERCPLRPPQFLTLYSFSSNLKASLHSRRLLFEEAGWREFYLKLAIVNGLWSKGRLPSQWSIRPTTGGFSSFRTRGLTYSPEGLEGHCNLMASCWPSSPTLLSSAWHAPQNCLVLLYGRILNYCFCPFSNIEQEISTVQSILRHLKVEL